MLFGEPDLFSWPAFTKFICRINFMEFIKKIRKSDNDKKKYQIKVTDVNVNVNDLATNNQTSSFAFNPSSYY